MEGLVSAMTIAANTASRFCLFIATVGLNVAPCLAAESKAASDAPSFKHPPQVISSPGPEYAGSTRKFQGIPSLTRAPQGRLWAVWYGGRGAGEDHHNYVIAVTSGDDGKTWSQEALVIDPDGEGPVRAFDPEAWIDPDGKLWIFWAQAVGHDGTEGGVWAVTTNTPDVEKPQWSDPRRITDGVMMCKPMVLKTGEWVLPASTWRATDNSARMVVSTDRGKTWTVRGAAHVPPPLRNYDEHSIVERGDGSLWMLVRIKSATVGESTSTDRGKTWSEVAPGSIKHTVSRFFVRRLQSGKLLLVKHADNAKGRSHLAAYLSDDDGATWQGELLLDERSGVSYPDGVQADDGRIYIIYDFDRRGAKEIRMAVFREEDIAAGKPVAKDARLKVLVNTASSPRGHDQ